MTIRKSITISAAFLLLVFNTVSAQDEWDSLDDNEEESDDEYEDDERPPEPESFPEQARDDEVFMEPVKQEQDDKGGEPSDEDAPLPAAVPKEDKPISAGLLVGYGFSFEDDKPDWFAIGFGLRGGYTFDMGVYAGAKFIYYLGGEEEPITRNAVTIAVEGGFKLELDPLLFLPSLELGLALLNQEDSAGRLNESSTEFYLAPALSVLFPFDMFFIGVDLSIPIIFKDPTVKGFSLMATGGVSL